MIMLLELTMLGTDERSRSQDCFTARPVSYSDGRARTTSQGYSLC